MQICQATSILSLLLIRGFKTFFASTVAMSKRLTAKAAQSYKESASEHFPWSLSFTAVTNDRIYVHLYINCLLRFGCTAATSTWQGHMQPCFLFGRKPGRKGVGSTVGSVRVKSVFPFHWEKSFLGSLKKNVEIRYWYKAKYILHYRKYRPMYVISPVLPSC